MPRTGEARRAIDSARSCGASRPRTEGDVDGAATEGGCCGGEAIACGIGDGEGWELRRDWGEVCVTVLCGVGTAGRDAY